MGEDLSIVLKAMLDQYSLKDIITQINNLSGKTVIKTDLLINDDSLKKIDKSIDGLGERFKKLNKITLFKDSDDKVHKQINELSDALGNIEKRIYSLNKEGNLEFSSSVEIQNLEKQKKEYEKIINLLERVDSAKNKVYEDLDSQYGFIDIKGLEKVDNSLNNINLDTENLFTNYKQINSEVTKYEKQLKLLENNANKQRQTIDYAQTIQQVKELEDAEKELAKWKEDFSKKNISEADYEILKQETLAKIKSDAIRQQLEEQVRLNAELDKQDTLEREIALTKQNLQNKLSDITVKNDKYSVDELNRLRDSINNVSADTPKAKLKLKELSSEITQFGVEAKKSSSTTNSFSDSLKRFLTFYSLHDVIQTTKRVVRELVDTVYDLAESLLEIQKVSDLTGSSLDSFVKQSYKIGDSLSKTGKSVIDATTIFKRAGYDLNESTELAQSALIMQSVAENIRDVETASTSLISVLKGYGFETNKTTHIVDAFNQVSNTQATNFDTLVEGSSRISAVMRQQGNSFEEMIGLLTGATEVLGVDAIERVSTQLRTLSLRLASMNEETGKFEPEIISSLNDEFERLAGISLVDENKQIKSTYDIMNDMAKVMPTLDKNTRSYLMELASGKRGMETMEAIMINWENVEKATNSAVNSYGSSADEFQKYTESILGKTEKLKGAWEELAITTLNDDTIAWFLDATTSIIKLTTATGGLTPVVIGLVSAFALLNAVKFKNTAIDIIGVFAKITAEAKITTASIKATVVALNGLSLASKLFVGGAIVATVMAVGYGINYLSKESDRAKEAVNTLSLELKDLQSQEVTVQDLSKQYVELRKLKKEQGLNNEEQQRFTDIQNQLRELLPKVNGAYNIQGNFIIDEDESLTSLNETYKEYIALKREDLATAARENSKYTIKNYQKEKEELEGLIEYYKLRNSYLSGELDDKDKGRYAKLFSDYGGKYGTLSDIENGIKDVRAEVDNLFVDLSKETADMIKNSNAWDNLTDAGKEALNRIFTEYDDTELLELNEKLAKNLGFADNYIKDTTVTEKFKKIREELEKTSNTANKVSQEFTKLEETIKSLASTRSNIESLTNVLNNLNDGNFSASDMEELLSISEEFLPYLNDEIALREKLNETITDYKETYKKEYYNIISTSEEYYNARIKGDTELHNTLSSNIEEFFNGLGIAYKDDFDNYTDLENAKLKLTNNIVKQLAGEWFNYFDSFGNIINEKLDPRFGSGATASYASGLAESALKIKNAKDSLFKIIDDTVYEPIDINFDSKSAKGKDKYVEAFQKQYDELRYLRDKDLISAQQYYDGLKSLNDKYFAGNSKYIDQFRQYDLELYNLQKELAEKHIENVVKSYEKANKEIERSITQLDLQQQLVNDNSQEYIDIERKKYSEIVKLETELQRTIAELQSIGTEQAREQAESLIDTYYDTVQQRNSIIANLQSSQISLFESQISDLERQKSALEDLHNFTMQMIKDELNAKKKSYQEDLKGIEAVFNAKKKALRDEQDTRNYNKGLTEKSSVVADLENQLALIKNDETAIAKRKQLEQDLAKAKEDLANYQYDHSIDLAEKALDEELEIQKSKLEEEIEELDDTLSNEVTMRELANKRIEKSGEKLKNQLIKHAKEYGTFTIEEVTNAWDVAGEAVENFDSKQQGLLATLKEISQELINTQKNLKEIEKLSTGEYGAKIGAGTGTINREQSIAKMQANSEQWNQADPQKKQELAEENQKLGKALGLTYDESSGIWYYDKQKKLRVYHEGGVVGGTSYATKSTEELAKLLKGELVITPPQADKVMDMITNNSNSEISISIPIVIEGNADSETVKALEKQMNKLADTVIDKLKTARANSGFKNKPKFV